MIIKTLLIFIICTLNIISTNGSKYSEELNKKKTDNVNENDRPFRIWKLNVVWQKAIQVSY